LIWLAVLKDSIMMYQVSEVKPINICDAEEITHKVDLTQLHKLYLNIKSDRPEFYMQPSPLPLRLNMIFDFFHNYNKPYWNDEYRHYIYRALRPYEYEQYILPVMTPLIIIDTTKETSVLNSDITEFCYVV
jgi:hypothetical protein